MGSESTVISSFWSSPPDSKTTSGLLSFSPLVSFLSPKISSSGSSPSPTDLSVISGLSFLSLLSSSFSPKLTCLGSASVLPADWSSSISLLIPGLFSLLSPLSSLSLSKFSPVSTASLVSFVSTVSAVSSTASLESPTLSGLFSRSLFTSPFSSSGSTT